MYIEKYMSQDHNSFVTDWLQKRDLPNSLAFDLPEVGFIVSERGEPIAVGFIRRCEGNCGMIDSLISNPDAPSDMRHSAIDLVVDQVLKTAKDLELKSLI